MQIKSYDEIDPTDAFRLSSTAFGWTLTASEMRRIYRRDPRYAYGPPVYAVDRGRALAQVVPMRFPVRLTSGVEDVGGLQGVCSLPSVWGQGYARRLMEHVHAMFRADGLRISTLTTSRNIRGYRVYGRLGYVDVAPFFRGTRAIPKDGRPSTGLRIRRAGKGDLPRIHELYERATRGLLGWTERSPLELPAAFTTFPWFRGRYRVGVRGRTIVGYLRSRPDGGALMEEVLAPAEGDFRTLVAGMESKARGGVATANWITCRRDARRFRRLGYRLDRISDTTMAVPLTRDVRTRDLPALFGGTDGQFVQYPTDDF
ncbi:MAG TPA: GNAT family N-acetyltransferase [Thermoplasmata archaeon]|nr:GNAT family N-acetyltransferase [Thermoplasmata archaeon]